VLSRATRLVIDRHFELLQAVEDFYRRRHESPEMRRLCEATARQHLLEFPGMIEALKKLGAQGGDDNLPRVPTFQYYATLLSEECRFDEAVEICELALNYDLHDNTVGGFEGRIERIQRLQRKV
jgi:hypothetical protein